MNAEIAALLKSRHTLLWIRTREDVRVERACMDAGGACAMQTEFWDCATGLSDAQGKPIDGNLRNPTKIIERIGSNENRRVYVMRDLHKWLGNPVDLRGIKSLARALQVRPADKAAAVIILSPEGAEIPPELAGCTTVLDYPMPDRAEIAQLLDDAIKALPEKIRETAAPNGVRENGDRRSGRAQLRGGGELLTRRASSRCAGSIRSRWRTRRSASSRASACSPGPTRIRGHVGDRRARRAQGLARQAAHALQREGSHVRTAGAARRAAGRRAGLRQVAHGEVHRLRVGDAAAAPRHGRPAVEVRRRERVEHPEGARGRGDGVACVLWIDELEKALAGSTGEQGDGGVSADALGAVLSWMQERQGKRASWSRLRTTSPRCRRSCCGVVDGISSSSSICPTRSERAEIIDAAVKAAGRELTAGNADVVAGATDGFSGAEIAALVPDAMSEAFGKDRDLQVDDLLEAAVNLVPQSKMAAEKIDGLRKWAKVARVARAERRRSRPRRLVATWTCSSRHQPQPTPYKERGTYDGQDDDDPPGLLLGLKTSVKGGVKYKRLDLPAEDGQERWETTKTVDDKEELERAQKLRSKVGNSIRAVCAQKRASGCSARTSARRISTPR
jgi:hypothetical protein